MITAMLLFFNSMSCILVELLIFVQLWDPGFVMNYLCLLPGVLRLSLFRKVPHLGRYPFLLKGLPYTLEVVTHREKLESSLEGYEIVLKHLTLDLLRSKIIKTK